MSLQVGEYMNNILEKLDELELIINNNSLFNEFFKIKNEILKDQNILNMKKQLELSKNIYTNEYKDLKIKYLTNEKVKEYMFYENQIYILTLEINKRMKSLIKGD